MTSPPASASTQATTLTQSREAGDVIPNTRSDGLVAKQDGPVAKPWAHFVAGG